MKERISATVDKEVIKIINSLMEKRKYRNKSHVIESAICLLQEREGINDKNKK
ncbi:MAG: ribbon-helix-helix protein, CopG family [Nanoarchaeota archaeon]